MNSLMRLGNTLSFPSFTKERAYMIPHKKDALLPARYSRWQKVVDSMLATISTTDTIYMTIDQGEVLKGTTQRRGGAHIDGNYSVNGWDTPGPNWRTSGSVGGGIILASDCIGAKAYLGILPDDVGEGGDCSHMDLSDTTECVLQPNQVYIGNGTLVHETIPATEHQLRSFIRLTLPESYKFAA